MQNLTEETLLCHVEGGQLKEVVHAVFQHHAMFLCAFSRIDQCPNLIHVGCCGYFNGHMLSMVHGIKCYWHMMNPVGCDVDDVDVLAFAHLLVCIYTATVGHSSMSSMFIKLLLAKLYAVSLYVTKSHDVRSRNLAPSFYGTNPAHSQPNKAHANRL